MVIVDQTVIKELQFSGYETICEGDVTAYIISQEQYKHFCSIFRSAYPPDDLTVTQSIMSSIYVAIYPFASRQVVDTFTDEPFKRSELYKNLINFQTKDEELFNIEYRKFIERLRTHANAKPEDEQPSAQPVDNVIPKCMTEHVSDGYTVYFAGSKSEYLKTLATSLIALAKFLKKDIMINSSENEAVVHELLDYASNNNMLLVDLSMYVFSKYLVHRPDVHLICFGIGIENLYQFQCKQPDQKHIYSAFQKIFKDTISGTVFAFYKSPCLSFAFPLEEEFMEQIINAIIVRWDGITPAVLEWDRNAYQNSKIKNIDEYCDLFIRSRTTIIEQVKKSLEELIDDIRELQGTLAEKMKIYNMHTNFILNFDEQKYKTDMHDKAKKSLEELIKLKYVRSVSLSKTGDIVVHTNNIYCRHPVTNKLHDLGTFKIQLNMLNPTYDPDSSIIIKNTKHNIKCEFTQGVMEAPHIFNNGIMCHGNLIMAVTQHYAEQDIYGLIVDVIAFLESVNLSDVAGKSIERFPVVEEFSKEDEYDQKLTFVLKGADNA